MNLHKANLLSCTTLITFCIVNRKWEKSIFKKYVRYIYSLEELKIISGNPIVRKTIDCFSIYFLTINLLWSRERKFVSGPAFLPRSQILGWKWFRGEGGDCRFCWFGAEMAFSKFAALENAWCTQAFSNICQVCEWKSTGWGRSWVWIPDLLFTSWVILANLIMILFPHLQDGDNNTCQAGFLWRFKVVKYRTGT